MTPDQPDIRWQQRFQNFDRAFTLFHAALQERLLDACRYGPAMQALHTWLAPQARR
jgi:hypothetical protein